MPTVRQVKWPDGSIEKWIEPQAPPGVGAVVSTILISQGEYDELRAERRKRLEKQAKAAAKPAKKPAKASADGD